MFILGCIGLFSGIIFGRIAFPRRMEHKDEIPGPFAEVDE